ncbi:hypothetical protein [Ectothiorhodospira shaposhnikovii]|uniref:hypothetical protein n=1 Tax=Ectothiorhodospira shaposhnikovii TaxID=1054 RepID=UPI001EE8100C|nr:hypothetical protein [Ectothiorhodospira shaposhnikovii]MCG5511918.1 hypothetical protein [Ectothiorhodospira shaposhnikovii]
MLVGTPMVQLQGDDALPLQPRKVKRWLKALPMADMGETTRRLLQALQALNGRSLPPAERLEIMELLHPSLLMVQDHLGRHFINRSLPLPPRGLQIAHIAGELLAETSTGYLRVLRDLRGIKKTGLSTRQLTTAIYQGLNMLGAQQRHAARLYLPAPPGTWQAMHELLADAEYHGILHQELTDEQSKQRTPAQAYLQAALLALAAPLTLRQGESDRLHRHLEAHCATCHIGSDALPDHAGMLYRIDLRSDRAPDYITPDELDNTATSRFLRIAPLIRQLRDLVRQENSRPLDNDLIHRALIAWTNTARRRFNRTGRAGRIDVTTGLADIHHCITRKVDADLGKRSTDTDLTQLSLQEIDYNLRSMEMGISVRYLADMPKDLGSSAWDSIAKGNLVTSTTLPDNGTAPPSPETPTPQAWQLVDSSAGGFRLRWEQPQAGRVQVGELVGLRSSHEGAGAGWQLGIVRWMMFHPATGLEIGVQILAPRSLPIMLRRAKRRLAHGQPLEGLMSPTIQVLQQATSLFCPAGAFQVDDEVAVILAGRTLSVRLTRKLAHSSRFEQFAYEPLKDLPQDREDSDPTLASPAIWSSI